MAAASRRVLHGLRLARASVALVQRKVGFGLAAEAVEVGTSYHCFQPRSEREIHVQRWKEEEGGRWSLWRHLVPRNVHRTAWREDEEEKQRAVKQEELRVKQDEKRVANEEARNLVQHVHLASLKKKLKDDPRDTICYEELLQLCQTIGMASDKEDACRMAHAFNDAGVVITFKDKVHLHPEKIAKLVANVLPLSLLGEDDQRRMELMALAKKKAEIDKKAHKQMRLVLWTGLIGLTAQMMIFFRLTFWELSWDVMEPIAFFATGAGLICGYAYFMITSRDPSYQDFMHRIYHSRQRKLFKKQNFDIQRYKELQMQCETGWKPLTKKILDDAD